MRGLSALHRGEETRVNRGKKSISAAVCSLNGGISLQPLLSCLLLALPGSHLSHGAACQDKHGCTAKQSPGEQNRGCVGTRGGTVTNTQWLELADPSRAHPSLPVLSCAPHELGHLTVHVSATRTLAQHIWGSHISAVHSSGTHVSKKWAPPGRVPPSLQGCESRRCSAPKGMLGAGGAGPDPGDQQ